MFVESNKATTGWYKLSSKHTGEKKPKTLLIVQNLQEHRSVIMIPANLEEYKSDSFWLISCK